MNYKVQTIPPPRLDIAYAQLAPLVSEAFAYMESGNTSAAAKTLREAKQLIDQMAFPFGRVQAIRRKDEHGLESNS